MNVSISNSIAIFVIQLIFIYAFFLIDTGKTLHEALSALQSRMVEKSSEPPLENGMDSVVQAMQEL